MTRIATFWETSVGKKAVMAVTGLVLVAYLITHVLANLLGLDATPPPVS